MMKTKTITNAHRFLGAAALLLLIAAALFVGAAAAITVGPITVNSAEELATNISKLDTQTSVDIIIASDIGNVDAKNLKKILVAVGNATTGPKFAEKYLNISIGESGKLSITPDSAKSEQKVILSGAGTINVTRTGTSLRSNVAELTVNELTIEADHSSSEKVTVKNTGTIIANLSVTGDEKFVEASGTTSDVTISTKSSSLTYKIKSAVVDKKKITLEVKADPYYIDAKSEEKMSGKITLTDGTTIQVTDAEGDVFASYNQKLAATGNITSATVIYTPNGKSGQKVQLVNVNGNYGNGATSLSGDVKLVTDLTITHVLPIPSFVTGNLYLEGMTLSTTKDKYFEDKDTPAVKVMSKGQIDIKGLFDKQFDYDSDNLVKTETSNQWVFTPKSTPSPHGGGGGGGSSITPNYTPTVTPTPTQPWTPIDPSQTGVQPSQSPKSPMPVFGILAGLGAAALAGVVLRRK